MLLITDRPAESRSLERLLALWGRCSVVDLGEVMGRGDQAIASAAPPRIVVSQVELSDKTAIEALRRALARHRPLHTPYLCLLKNRSPRAVTQAQAIGASHILSADAPSADLLKSVGEILQAGVGPGDDAARVQAHFVAATAAIADLLGAAADGRALPQRAIEDSVASINEAADEADLAAWLDVVWNHDDLTYQHCLLVAGLTAAFSRQLGFGAKDRRLMTCAAVLHDIGKARISLDILHKEGPLSAEEWVTMRTHPAIGAQMLLASGSFAGDIVTVARSHHEFLDGSGYPDGLRGDAIPDIVRLITICDIYAALIEKRSYRPPMPAARAYDILLEMGGKLDGDLVRAFRRVVLDQAGDDDSVKTMRGAGR